MTSQAQRVAASLHVRMGTARGEGGMKAHLCCICFHFSFLLCYLCLQQLHLEATAMAWKFARSTETLGKPAGLAAGRFSRIARRCQFLQVHFRKISTFCLLSTDAPSLLALMEAEAPAKVSPRIGIRNHTLQDDTCTYSRTRKPMTLLPKRCSPLLVHLLAASLQNRRRWSRLQQRSSSIFLKA